MHRKRNGKLQPLARTRSKNAHLNELSMIQLIFHSIVELKHLTRECKQVNINRTGKNVSLSKLHVAYNVIHCMPQD